MIKALLLIIAVASVIASELGGVVDVDALEGKSARWLLGAACVCMAGVIAYQQKRLQTTQEKLEKLQEKPYEMLRENLDAMHDVADQVRKLCGQLGGVSRICPMSGFDTKDVEKAVIEAIMKRNEP